MTGVQTCALPIWGKSSCPISWKRWRRKYAMPSEEMVFMKRMIFPFLIKVRPSLRDSAFSLRFPAENFRTAKFSAGKTLRKRRDGRKRDSEGENCDRRSACATRKRTVREPPFHAVPRHETTFLSGCGEGSPAPSALHMRVVLPISTSAGIACPFLEKNGLPQRVA